MLERVWRKGNPLTLLQPLWKQPLWKTSLRRFLKKLKVELPYEPAIPLQGIYSEKKKTLIQKDACTPIFIAALLTVAKTWKQPNVHRQRNG